MDQFNASLEKTAEIGFVEEVIHSIAYVSGLPGATPNELVVFENGGFGEVVALSNAYVEVLIFSRTAVKVGMRMARTGKMLEIPVGQEFLGQAVNPLGELLDSTKTIKKSTDFRQIDIPAPGIETRSRIKKPLDTGVTLLDMMIPLGKGQRQLAIGDRKTGKTAFLLRTILTQARQGTICIYAGIGKKKLDIKRIEEFFVKNGIAKNTIIVASSPEDLSGIIFLTPYSAMTIAEYFRDQGKDALVILDDLTSHAKFYREISLLGRRFPGRNSYPGDIFFTHARLLERAGNFIINGKDCSITCIPVAETMQGDLSGYIQTNIMSMTDGHIYFDSDLFARGRRPAINPFLSVTRVGHQTQNNVQREINRELTSFLTLYEKMQSFIHFGAELNENIKNIIATGERILYFFGQTENSIFGRNVQTFLFCLLWLGLWNKKSVEDMEKDMLIVTAAYDSDSDTRKKIDDLVAKAKAFNEYLTILRVNANAILAKTGVKLEQEAAAVPENENTT